MMGSRFFLTALVMLILAPRAEAGEFVPFKSGNATLVGYLVRPPGKGPFPAAVLLHGSGGFHASMLSWADRLGRWGYVALAVDSVSPRGRQGAGNVAHEQAGDAFAALHYLVQRPHVRAEAVALVASPTAAARPWPIWSVGPRSRSSIATGSALAWPSIRNAPAARVSWKRRP
jgi:hypothetical protein